MSRVLRSFIDRAAIPIFAVILGLVAGSVLVVFARANPIEAYQHLFCEGFGAKGCQNFGDLVLLNVPAEDGTTQTVFAPFYGEGGHKLGVVGERATVLILCALAATVAFQAGMFSIGMDGQLALGAVTVAFLGYWLPNQLYALFGTDPDNASQGLLTAMHLIVPLVCIAAAMAVGAFWSWIAGYLKVKLNVNELISTIILNTIAVQIVGYLINYPLRSDFNNIARTARIDDTAWLMPFARGIFQDVDWFSGSRMGIGFIFALLAAFLLWFFLWRSAPGYEQRMTRGSRLFARFGGIPSERAAIRAMLISGALSGLAGAIQILGVERRVVDGFAGSGLGFDGVLVAILARESIPAILVVAVFFAGLNQGATNLQFADLPRELGSLIIAFIILFSSMEDFFRSSVANLRARLQLNKPRPAEVTS